MNDDKIIEIVEDNALKDDFLVHLSTSLTHGLPLPRYVPLLNDSMMSKVLDVVYTHLRCYVEGVAYTADDEEEED